MAEELKETRDTTLEEKELDSIDFDFMKDDAEADKDADAGEGAEKKQDVNPDDEELDLDLTFLGKQTRLKKGEARTALQKGMNYDHIKGKFETAEAELAKLRVDIAAKEATEQRRQMEEKLTNEGYDAKVILDMIDNHPSIKRAEEIAKTVELKEKELARQKTITDQKELLKDKPYFKEIEREADEITKNNPQSDFLTAYRFLYGTMMLDGKLDEIKKTANKAAAADLQDKMKRGGAISSDSVDDNSIDASQILDRESMEMTHAFGIDPKKIAKYVAEQLKGKKKG